MALFEYTDDRDTFISQTLTPEQLEVLDNKFKVWLTMLKNELPANVIVDHLGDGRYRLELPYIGCTGSDVEQIINIPFMHQLLKMELKHTDSANADATDALTYSLYQRYHANTWAIITIITDSIASDMTDEYIDYYKLRGEYRLIVNTTNTDRAHVAFYIKITGE